jgi:methionyl-tRNA formyltransferase
MNGRMRYIRHKNNQYWQVRQNRRYIKKFDEIGPSLLINTLKLIINWNLKWQKQNEQNATYCNKISKEDWKVNFQLDTWTDIYNKYKSYYNWPWIFTFYKNKKLNLEEVELKSLTWTLSEYKTKKIASVIKIDKNNVWIVTKDEHILILKQVKLEWKKSMNILSFINGNKEFLDYIF